MFDYAVPVGIWLAGAWTLSRLVGGLLSQQFARARFSWAVPRLVRDALTLIIFMGALAGIIATSSASR